MKKISENEYCLTELFKEITNNKTKIDVNNLNGEMMKMLIGKCSSEAFNIFVIRKDGSLSVLTQIIDPVHLFIEDKDIVAISQLFIIDNGSAFSLNPNNELEKLIYIIKKAYNNREWGFSIVYGKY